MKICIFGAGVIGGVLAAACARAGHDVSLIARGPHLAAIRANGLKIVTPADEHTWRLRASDDPAMLGQQDVVIVCTKTPALPDVARTIAPLLHEKTQVGFSLNGVLWFYPQTFPEGAVPDGVTLDCARLDPQGLLQSRIGVARSFGVIAWAGGEITEPGIVQTSRAGGIFAVGAAMPANGPVIAQVVNDMALKHVEFSFAPDIRVPLWRKYMSAVGNFAVCTLTGADIGAMQANAPTQELALAIMGEAFAVARAHGVDGLQFDVARQRANPAKSDHKPSMLQDLERGRVMEIDSAFLALQDLARGAGVATPVLDTLAPILQMRARTAGCYTG